MAQVIEFLDSDDYACAASWNEHVVLTYRLACGRSPTVEEFVLLQSLCEDSDLRRSFVLSYALRGDGQSTSWEQCRRFADEVALDAFAVTPALRIEVQALERLVEGDGLKCFDDWSPGLPPLRPAPAFEPTPPSDAEYNIYFGYLHAHCGISDGDGTPLEAYRHARDQGGLDFFALTDHGEHLGLWPWEDKWGQLIEAADATYEPGRFVSLYGFEWSNPVLGHISIVNSEDWTSCITTPRLGGLYRWLSARPEAFGRFNHPGRNDYLGVGFLWFLPHPWATAQMVGIETWNKDSGFDRFHYAGSWHSAESYIDRANGYGWRLGALGAQDNHDRDWGSRNAFRTAVLAQELTREAIVDAYHNRRFYATEDADLYLMFSAGGYPVGSVVRDGPRVFNVTAWDGSGDTFRQVRLYRNGQLIVASAHNETMVDVTLMDEDAPPGDAYYYVMVTQNDDTDGNGRNDEVLSSPIWFRGE